MDITAEGDRLGRNEIPCVKHNIAPFFRFRFSWSVGSAEGDVSDAPERSRWVGIWEHTFQSHAKDDRRANIPIRTHATSIDSMGMYGCSTLAAHRINMQIITSTLVETKAMQSVDNKWDIESRPRTKARGISAHPKHQTIVQPTFLLRIRAAEGSLIFFFVWISWIRWPFWLVMVVSDVQSSHRSTSRFTQKAMHRAPQRH